MKSTEELRQELQTSQQALSAIQSKKENAEYELFGKQQELNLLQNSTLNVHDQLNQFQMSSIPLQTELNTVSSNNKTIENNLLNQALQQDKMTKELQIQKSLFEKMKDIHSSYKELKTEKLNSQVILQKEQPNEMLISLVTKEEVTNTTNHINVFHENKDHEEIKSLVGVNTTSED